MKISIDLDDGVKVNYEKFGKLLAEKKAVAGKKGCNTCAGPVTDICTGETFNEKAQETG
jgi:hypothetical protein